ncbi:helix-turn-helix transcriptional regulator [Actinophytocola sp. NPDC049390]|uniref:helix-turn-helix transcriptional regulator n=1 Tax=Actinophytocola sp. NPDC049390 TaxID=3363894 RepID=UPI0037A3C810
MDEFGPWLARQLRRAGMTQAQLAERLQLTRAAVSAWITGRSEPREETKRAIAMVFDTEPAAVYNLAADLDTNLPRRWYHRPAHADGGREYGNAAAFAFDADLSVLAKEATQNSLDERLDHNRAVRVRYVLQDLTGDRRDSFLENLQWRDLDAHYAQAANTDQKVSRSLRAALDELAAGRSLRLLRVEDYNASGLIGPEYRDGQFAAVVRRQLDSFKKQASGRAGGSYGLGKATLWATSQFGLVLINSTLSEPFEGRTRRRVIGRLDLPWHAINGAAFAGPAWFGEPDTEPEHRGVSRSWWAGEQTVQDLHLEREGDDPGTSFLIVGAHDASGVADELSDMHDRLVRALADNFWAAMVSGRGQEPMLEASVTALYNDQVVIPEKRIDPHEHHPALSRALKAYLDGETVEQLTEGKQVAQARVPLVVPPRKAASGRSGATREHGAVLLLTPADDSEQRTNRVILMRGNRMTVREHRPRELLLGAMAFQAVLLAGYATGMNGDDVDLAEAFLRASEPPEHNRWDRTEELTSTYVRGALSRIREFQRAIDDAVRSLVGKRESSRGNGPAILRELLRLDATGPNGPRRAQPVPVVRNVNAYVTEDGAWNVTVALKLPEVEDPWLLTPVAKFDVRSGSRPDVSWRRLAAAENCRIENGNLLIEPGVRSASFTGVTDPTTHPVRGGFARLVVDIQKTRGGSA